MLVPITGDEVDDTDWSREVTLTGPTTAELDLDVLFFEFETLQTC